MGSDSRPGTRFSIWDCGPTLEASQMDNREHQTSGAREVLHGRSSQQCREPGLRLATLSARWLRRERGPTYGLSDDEVIRILDSSSRNSKHEVEIDVARVVCLTERGARWPGPVGGLLD